MTPTTSTADHSLELCNKFLRGERSAVETYDQAIEKFGHKQDLGDLQRIRDEHREAVTRLEEHIRTMGGTPDQDSGAWGTFAKAVQGAANLIGADSAISSLQQGESHGRSDYADALEDIDVLPEVKEMVRTHLLPRTDDHIQELARLAEPA